LSAYTGRPVTHRAATNSPRGVSIATAIGASALSPASAGSATSRLKPSTASAIRRLATSSPFLLGPDGRPDDRVNGFFASARMRARSPLTWKKYAHSLGLWLNFLLALGKRWDEATEEDAGYFKEWRLTRT
jgi:hypothetical protein